MKLLISTVPEETDCPLRDCPVAQIIVHRIKVSQEDASFRDTAQDIARFFREHPVGRKATGGAMPYPLLVDASGQVIQTVTLNRVTPHARSYNASTIGVACIGDFRQHPMPETQWDSLVATLAELCRQYQLETRSICGHDELDAASHDPNKECPGSYLDMNVLRQAIEVSDFCPRFDFR